jgi:hypothetical protein
LTFGASGIDGGIDTAKARNRAIDQVADVVIAAHIRGDEFRLGARTAKLGCKRFPLGLVAAGDDDVGAVLGKSGGGGATDAGQGARDQDDWIAHILILTICSAVTRKVQWKLGSALATADRSRYLPLKHTWARLAPA